MGVFLYIVGINIKSLILMLCFTEQSQHLLQKNAERLHHQFICVLFQKLIFDMPVFHPLVDPVSGELDVRRAFTKWRYSHTNTNSPPLSLAGLAVALGKIVQLDIFL